MLALDTALHCEERVGGAVLVSGFLMDVNKWGERLGTVHRNIKVLQLHGKSQFINWVVYLFFFPFFFLVCFFFFFFLNCVFNWTHLYTLLSHQNLSNL
jgi:hypothetical protein